MMTRLMSFTAIVLACVGAARAQPVSTGAPSIEWATTTSCLIVRGVIDDGAVHALKGSLYGDVGVNSYSTVSVRVLETLKGKHSDRLQFVQNFEFGPTRLAKLQEDQQELLLFLEPWERSGYFRRASGGYAYTRFPYVVKYIVLLTPDDCRWAQTSGPLLAANLTRLSTPQQTIETVKAYLADRGERASVRGVTMQLPPELRGEFYEATFTFPLNDDVVGQPFLDFERFRERFAGEPPAETKPSYSRKAGGNRGIYSLELMAADCDAIVLGVVEDSCFVGGTPDGVTADSYVAKIRMIEAFKGTVGEHFACFITDAGDLESLRREKQEVILFLRSNLNQGLAYPLGAVEYRTRARLWGNSVIVLKEASAEVLFCDMTWHRDLREILARLQAATASSGYMAAAEATRLECSSGKTAMFSFHPPASLGTSIEGNPYSILYLPVNGELEENARKWASADSKDLRWLAARAMIYFKSDENAAVLRGMLDDEATWDRRELLHMTGLAYPHRPQFLVRWEAWHVLVGWGYDVPRPVFTSE